jgi:hypothetical protein
MAEVLATATCAFCGKPAEGDFGIHRDGFGVGPELPLCTACGSEATPTCEEIWDRIAQPAAGDFAHRKKDE